jgi:FAD:protein FMN transferase
MRNFFYIFLASILVSCTHVQKQVPVKLQGETQGTYYSITYFDNENRDFQKEIDSILHDFDLSVSLWVPNSIISKVNNNDTSVILDKYFIDNFNLSEEVSQATGGSFDCTVAPLVKAWGFGFDETKQVDQHIIDSIEKFVGFQKVRLENTRIVKEDPRMSIDFNAIAQGYSVDVISAFLENNGIKNYLIDIGGEVKGKGQKPDGSFWMVGIEKPAANQDSERALKAVVALKNKSIATSGNYRKYYEENGIRYSHTIDPKTGYPVQHSLLSASVMADNTAVADAYATSFMVMGFEKSRDFVENHKNLDAFFIYSDDDGVVQTYLTNGFRKALNKEFE